MSEQQQQAPIGRAILEAFRGEKPVNVTFGQETPLYLTQQQLTIHGQNIEMVNINLGQDGGLGDLGVKELHLVKKIKDKNSYKDIPAIPGEEINWNSVDAVQLYAPNPDGSVEIIHIPKENLSLEQIPLDHKPAAPTETKTQAESVQPAPDTNDDTTTDQPNPAQEPAAPNPDRQKIKLDVAVAAVKGDIKKDEDVEITESRMEASQSTLESSSEMPKNLVDKLKQSAKKIWKQNWWKTAYQARDRVYNIGFHERADIPAPLAKDLRDSAVELAKERLTEGKSEAEIAKMNRRWNWQEVEGFLTDVHEESLKVVKEWRDEIRTLADSNLDPQERARIEAENPLAPAVQGWYEASDEIARNLAEDILHTDRGEVRKKDALTILGDSDVGKKLKDDVIVPYLQAFMTGNNIPAAEANAREKLTGFFSSDEFQNFLNTSTELTPAEKALFQSRNYASNILEMVRNLPDQMQGAMNHQAGLDNVDFDIQLTLGVAEWGPRNKVESTWSETRAKKNQELQNRLRHRQDIFTEDQKIVATWKERLLRIPMMPDVNRKSVAQDILQNEFVYAAGYTGVLSVATNQMKRIPRFLVPIFGGAVTGGIIGGRKEARRLTEAYKLHNLEEAYGYAFPKTYEITKKRNGAVETVTKKTQRGEIAERSYQTRTMSDIDQSIVSILRDEQDRPKTDLTAEEAQQLLAHIVDLDARNKISDTRNINLLVLAPDDPGAPHRSFEQQKRALDRLSAEAKIVLRNNFDKIPVEITNGQNFTETLKELVNVHSHALNNGRAGDVRYEHAMGRLTVQEADSISKREAAFEKYKRTQAIKKGAQTAGIGFTIGIIGNEVVADAVHKIKTGNFEFVGPIGSGARWLGDHLPATPHVDVQNMASHVSIGNSAEQAFHYTQYVQTDHLAPITHNVAIDGHTMQLGNNMNVLPDGHGNYTFQTLANDGTVQGQPFTFKPSFDAKGNFSPSTMETFSAHGIHMNEPVAVQDAFATAQTLPSHEVTIPGTQLHVNTPDRITIHHDANGTYSFHMMDAQGTHDEVLASNVHFGTHGELLQQDEIQNKINASLEKLHEPYHVNITDTIHNASAEAQAAPQVFTKAVNEMGGSQGKSGLWGWVQESYRESAHPNTSTNFAKNVFRGWNENYMPDNSHVVGYSGKLINGEIDYRSLGPDVKFNNVPMALFSKDGLKNMGKLVDEAYTEWTHGVKPEQMDELHRMAYEIGIVGRVANKEEVTKLLNAFEIPKADVLTHTPTISLTHDVQASILPGITHTEIENHTVDTPVVPPFPVAPGPAEAVIPMGEGGGAVPFNAEPFMAPESIDNPSLDKKEKDKYKDKDKSSNGEMSSDKFITSKTRINDKIRDLAADLANDLSKVNFTPLPSNFAGNEILEKLLESDEEDEEEQRNNSPKTKKRSKKRQPSL